MKDSCDRLEELDKDTAVLVTNASFVDTIVKVIITINMALPIL